MKTINEYIDHTNLKANATAQDIQRLCQEAVQYRFAAVCVHPCRCEMAKALLAGSGVKLAVVVGFPFGTNTSAVKAFETRDAIARGCDEIDMVLNIGALKDGRYNDVLQDVKQVVTAAQGHTVKVILETCLLTDEEKKQAVRLCCEAGASFVKTSTGFSTGGATVQDVALMKAACAPGVQVKAAGGIRSYDDAMRMIEAGADRIGTSAGVKIMETASSR